MDRAETSIVGGPIRAIVAQRASAALVCFEYSGGRRHALARPVHSRDARPGGARQAVPTCLGLPAIDAMTPPPRLFDLSGRTVLVTGAGRGMGVGIARSLGRLGAKVAVNDFFADRAETTAQALAAEGLQACAAPGDITRPDVRAAIVQRTQHTFGAIDLLVNNAGVPPGMESNLRKFKDLGDDDFEQQLDLNLRAIVGLSRLVLPGMIERRFGRIVIVSSESWRVGIAFGITNYAAAKAAALGFMRQLAHEVGRKGVTVNAVSLGTMNNFGYDEQAKATAVGRAGTPEDVGALVAYLVSTEASWMTGQTLPLNGGAVTA